MAQRLLLEVPGMVSSYARTLLQEAFGNICDSQMWSWQLQVNGWLTPGLLFPAGPGTSVGTIAVTPFSNTVVGSAASSAAWLAYLTAGTMPLFTQLQIRSPFYSLYNIIAVNTANPAAIVLTLDRPWMEPGSATAAYMIYQAYFPVAVQDFKRFFAVRDTTNSAPLNFWSYSQKDLANIDPQRTIFDLPQYVVPYQVDNRPNSATLGRMLYELWPHPMSVWPYTYNYLRRGQTLVNPSDTVPYPMSEEAVLWKAKEAAYLFKEAQKGEQMQRGSGADWRFLSQSANEQYKEEVKPILQIDRDLCDMYFNRYASYFFNGGQPFSTYNGSLNVGQMV